MQVCHNAHMNVLHFAVTIFIVPAIGRKVLWLAKNCHTSWHFDEFIGSCRAIWCMERERGKNAVFKAAA